MKKGNRSWKPATDLVTYDKDPNYVYRLALNEQSNLDRKIQEGWEFSNKTTDPKAHLDASQEHDKVTGGMKYRELVLMRMPKDTAEARTQYYDERATAQERGLKDRLASDLEHKASVHGDIKIETIR